MKTLYLTIVFITKNKLVLFIDFFYYLSTNIFLFNFTFLIEKKLYGLSFSHSFVYIHIIDLIYKPFLYLFNYWKRKPFLTI